MRSALTTTAGNNKGCFCCIFPLLLLLFILVLLVLQVLLVVVTMVQLALDVLEGRFNSSLQGLQQPCAIKQEAKVNSGNSCQQ